MGWTSFEHRGKDTKSIMREQLNCSNESGTWEVIKDVTIAGGYVAVVNRFNTKTNKSYKFVAVCLISRNKYEFSYKDMSECMGPYITGVSDKFLRELDMLVPVSQYETPDMQKNAQEWRNRCRGNNVAKTILKQNVQQFRVGTKFQYGKAAFVITGEKQKVRFRGNKKAHNAFPLNTGFWIKESQLKKATIIK